VLWSKLAEELASWCCTSATRDIKTVTTCIEHEGLSFLTITLPAFAKDFELALDRGFVAHDLFTGFRFKGGLPRFMGGYLELVFDRDSGVLVDAPSIDAILAVRQLSLVYSKISIPCSDARVRKAMRGYIDCENDVRRAMVRLGRGSRLDFSRISRLLYARAFAKVDREVYYGKVVPRHGPGATADGLRGNGKLSQRSWPRRLEEVFSCSENLLPNWSFYDQLETVDIVEPGSETPVKVISVPKTQKTPRIIAMEPTCMQYMQQGLLAVILEALSEDDLLDSFLGFDDQTPNQRMAESSSADGSLATLDLSEASDRVAYDLVETMLADHPNFAIGVDACRSRTASVPGLGEVSLSKFASMGSALCFPFEAMVFLTVVLIGIEESLSTTLTRESLKPLRGKVRIYGDDIVIPVEHVHSVLRSLETFGFVTNVRKSFWNGKFRESCGKDYYDGCDVSVTKFRHRWPSSRRDAQEVISLVSFRNHLYFSGFWRTCEFLDDRIRKLLREFPVVLPSSPVLGRHSFLGYDTQRLGPYLHDPQVRGHVVVARSPVDQLDDWPALLKWFLLKARAERFEPEADVVSFEGHLERSGRPQSVNTKLRWASAV